MRRIFLFATLFAFSLVPSFVKAQRINTWVKKLERPQYTEGAYALTVGTSLEIISFYSYFEPFEWGKGQQLQIDFFAPDSEPYLLKAEEKRILAYYWMESKPGKAQKGKNTFGPWQVDGMLRQMQVSAANLGVLLRWREDKSNYMLPVSVYHHAPPVAIDSYKAVFRLGKSISKGVFKVYKGTFTGALPEITPVQTGVIGKNLGGATIQLAIAEQNLKDYSGWVTVHLTLSEQNSTNKTPFRFFFYHP